MKKAKKLLALIMAVIMLFSVMSVGMVAMAQTVTVNSNTGNDTYETTDDVIICVPETIYLTPSSGASTTAQYYVNNVVNADGSVSVEANSSATGSISIYSPGAIAMKFSTDVVSGGCKVSFGNTATSASFEDTIYSFSLIKTYYGTGADEDYFLFNSASENFGCFFTSGGLSAGKTALVEWKFTVYYGFNDDGSVDESTGVTYYAYTTLYSPIYNALGATTETRGSTDFYHQISTWVTGLTGVSTIQTSVGGYGVNSNADKCTERTGSFINEPLLGMSTVTKSSYGTITDTINTDGPAYFRGYEIGAQTSTSAQGSVGYLAVDTSRYTNTNQIPNFYIGSEVNEADDYNKTLDYWSTGHFYSWYLLSDAADGGWTHGDKNEDSAPSTWTKWVNITTSTATYPVSGVQHTTSGISNSYDLTNYAKSKGARYYLSPSLTVSSDLDAKYLHVMSQARAKYLTTNYYSNTYATVQFSATDKSDLRASVIQATSLDETKYTQNSWRGASASVIEEFQEALRDAAEVLGNPAASQSDIDGALAALDSKKEALRVVVHFDAATNGGTFTDGKDDKDYEVRFGKNVTIEAGAALLNHFSLAKAGYEFIGWTLAPDNDPLNASLDAVKNVTFGSTLYAHYRKTIDVDFYYLTGDGKTDVINYELKIYNNDKDKALDVDVKNADDVGDYMFAGWTTDSASTEGEELSGTLTGVTESANYYATYKKAVKLTLDATGGKCDDKEVVGGIGYNYDLSQTTGTASITLPEKAPTREGYGFKGWDINGTLYQAGDTVELTESTVATAQWKIDSYTVTFNYKNFDGTDASVTLNDVEYGKEVKAPEVPEYYYDTTNHYKFTGWDVAFNSISGDTVVTAVYADGEGHSDSYTGKFPTCTEAGEVVYTCGICGRTYTYSADAYGHSHQLIESKPATCKDEGYEKYKCSNCEDAYTVTLPATGHSFEGTEYVAPTCTEDGYYISGICANCGDNLAGVTIPALDHDWVEVERKAESCKEDGYIKYECSRGDATKEEPIPKHAHDWTSVTTPAKCEEDGKIVYTCSECSDSYTVTIEATGHSWATIIISPSCTSKGYTTVTCSNCGTSTRSDYVDALGHSWVDEVVAPTCTAQGYTKYTCSVCGFSYKTDFIDATGHDYSKTTVVEPTCASKGYTLHECVNENCGSYYKTDYVDALGHNYELKEIFDATLTMNGYKLFKCSRCHNEYKQTIYSDGKQLVCYTLYDNDGDVVANATITVTDSDGNTFTIKTDANGYFTHVFPSNVYSLSVTCRGYEDISGTLIAYADGGYNIELGEMPCLSCSCACHSDSFWGKIYRLLIKMFSIFGKIYCCDCCQVWQ